MPRFNSYFIDQNAARQAVALCLPMMEAAMQSREAGASGFLYIVVMRPGVKPGDCSFEEAILYEYALGDTTQWDADYGKFARAKAELSWRTGMSSQAVRQNRPQLLAEGDSLLCGGIVLHGFTVAVSGADPWFDEVFAGSVALTLRALARKGLAAQEGQPWLGQA